MEWLAFTIITLVVFAGIVLVKEGGRVGIFVVLAFVALIVGGTVYNIYEAINASPMSDDKAEYLEYRAEGCDAPGWPGAVRVPLHHL